MAEDHQQRRLATILAADVFGYSRLMAENEEYTLRTLKAYRGIIDHLISRHEGRIFGAAGDSFLAEFQSAVEAVRCAIAIQEELRVRNAQVDETHRMEFRIGLNVGDVLVDGDNLYGDGVNIAARLESIAAPGEICISGSVFTLVKNKLSYDFEDMGPQSVKNIPEPVSAFRLTRARAAPVAKTRKPFVAASMMAILVVLIAGIAGWVFRTSLRTEAPGARPAAPVVDEFAAAKAEQDRQAKAAQDAEAKRQADEAEQQRLAAIKAEQDRQAKAAQDRVDAENAYNSGTGYLQKGDYDRAIADYNESIRLNPNNYLVYANRGSAYLRKGRAGGCDPCNDQAIADYNEAIRLNPNNSTAFSSRALAYLRKGNYDHAIADSNEAIRLNPNNYLAFRNRGSAYLRKGNNDQSIADSSEAIRLNPDNSFAFADDAFNNRARAYMNKGDYGRAIADYDEAIQLNPTALAFCDRGIAKSKINDRSANADIAKARQLDPSVCR
jgi:class 3 adenylate cyclase/Tfp pilus assembly protein PilF